MPKSILFENKYPRTRKIIRFLKNNEKNADKSKLFWSAVSVR